MKAVVLAAFEGLLIAAAPATTDHWKVNVPVPVVAEASRSTMRKAVGPAAATTTFGPPLDVGGVTEVEAKVTVAVPAAEYSRALPAIRTPTSLIVGTVVLVEPDGVESPTDTAAGDPLRLPNRVEGELVATLPTNITLVAGVHEV